MNGRAELVHDYVKMREWRCGLSRWSTGMMQGYQSRHFVLALEHVYTIVLVRRPVFYEF